jgi:hypothetical protein
MEDYPLLRALLLREQIYRSMSQEERILLAVDRFLREQSKLCYDPS